MKSGSPGFTLTIQGTGFNAGSFVAFNGAYRTVHFVNSSELKVSITAADVANAGAYPVFVEDFPPGSNGCAEFGCQPFFGAQ